jgi:PAS domain S-box-containing protein
MDDARDGDLGPTFSSERFAVLFSGHPLPMWIYDLETLAFLDVNDAAVARYGYSRDEFLAMRLTDIRPEEEVDRLLSDARLTRSPVQHSGQWRHRLRDGRVVDVDIASGALEFRGRLAALVVVHDVTERNRAEATLRQSETRKTAVLDSVLDCIVTMDAHGVVIEFNAAAERTFGYTKAAAIGRALADLIIPPPLRAAHAAGLARYLATGEGPLLGKLIEITAVRSDGAEIPVELAITAIRSEAAPIFTGVLRDITARKHADETRARLAAIVDSSDDAIFSTALDDTILTWNAGAERLYGYPASEAIGRSRALVVPTGLSAELTAAHWEKAARGEAGEPFETQRVRKDGSLIDISLTISPMIDPTGRVSGTSTIARDITSRRKAEAELARLNEEIRLQRLRIFRATMRTVQDIVNNLLGSLQLAHFEAEGQLPDQMVTLVDRMVQEAAVKLKTLGDLETLTEKEMAIGTGIEYPGSAS